MEVRVPFLDKEFIDVAMSMDPEWKLVNLSSAVNEKGFTDYVFCCSEFSDVSFVLLPCRTTLNWVASKSG